MFVFCFFCRKYFTRIPLRAVFLSKHKYKFSFLSYQRLQHDTEECCVTLFVECILRQEIPVNLPIYCNSQTIPAFIQHAPHLMAVPFNNSPTRPPVSLAATLLARLACTLARLQDEQNGDANQAPYAESVQVILDLPMSSGEVFDLELDAACRDWCVNGDELRAVRSILAPFKRQADVWRLRAQWITACIQIGFCTSDDAERPVKKLCCL